MTGRGGRSAARRQTGTFLEKWINQALGGVSHALLLYLFGSFQGDCPLTLTHGRRLKQQRDDAEEVDVGVVDAELHEDGSGVWIQPPAPGQRLQRAEDESADFF